VRRRDTPQGPQTGDPEPQVAPNGGTSGLPRTVRRRWAPDPLVRTSLRLPGQQMKPVADGDRGEGGVPEQRSVNPHIALGDTKASKHSAMSSVRIEPEVSRMNREIGKADRARLHRSSTLRSESVTMTKAACKDRPKPLRNRLLQAAFEKS
jgi:hypothetical protein